MVALGGDLYIYGGIKRVQHGQDRVLSDVLVARACNGIVDQPWHRLDTGESALSPSMLDIKGLWSAACIMMTAGLRYLPVATQDGLMQHTS